MKLAEFVQSSLEKIPACPDFTNFEEFRRKDIKINQGVVRVGGGVTCPPEQLRVETYDSILRGNRFTGNGLALLNYGSVLRLPVLLQLRGKHLRAQEGRRRRRSRVRHGY